jgi:hypothetical protein
MNGTSAPESEMSVSLPIAVALTVTAVPNDLVLAMVMMSVSQQSVFCS